MRDTPFENPVPLHHRRLCRRQCHFNSIVTTIDIQNPVLRQKSTMSRQFTSLELEEGVETFQKSVLPPYPTVFICS